VLAKTNPFVTSRPDHAEHPHTARLLHTSDVHVGTDSRASEYVKYRSAFPDNVHIISKEEGELIVLGDAGVQVWGQAHSRYDDFAPVGMAPAWVDDVHAESGRRLWRVSVAHGHYVQSDFEKRYSYLVHDHELEALQAHYVGLGHLEVHTQVGPPSAAAWYAGSPDISGGATMIDLTPQGLNVRQVNFGSGTIGKTPLDSEYGPAMSALR